MNKNKEIIANQITFATFTSQEVQVEVNDLYDELERRFGGGFADTIIRRYTDVKPRQRG